MKKKMQVLSGVATAIVSTGVVNIQAEELPHPAEVKPAIEASKVQKAAVTEAEVTGAKTELDKASQAVSTQQEVVHQAQAEAAAAKTTANQAQNELVETSKLAEKATPENIYIATAAIAKEEEKVAADTQHLQGKHQEVAQADRAVKSQETVVSSVQAEANEKTQAIAIAQKEVDTAQAILDGTGHAAVIAKAEQAEKQLSESKKAFVIAQTELASAKESDTKRATAIKEAEKKLTQANTDLENKITTATQATAKEAETAKQLATAQSTFTAAENNVKAINTITLSAEYIAALKEYGNTYSQSIKEKLDALVPALRARHSFKANPNDDTTLLDTNNLSEAVRTELSLFASGLINQVRQLVGTKQTVVTKGALQFADKVADGYVKDNWSFKQVVTIGHDVSAINDVARQLGLRTSTQEEASRGFQYYENMHTVGQKEQVMTLSSAKRAIYQAMIEFLYNGREYFHALSILGINTESLYVGVDLSSRQDAFSVHVLSVSDSMIQEGLKFDKTAIQNSQTTADIQSQYEVAKNALAQATSMNNQAQEVKSKAIEAQTIAQDQATTAQAAPVLAPKAEIRFIAAERAVEKSEAEHKEAQANLANLKADVKVKQANLVRAKQTLEQKQAILNQANQVLAKEQGKLAQLQADLQQSQTNVKTAQEQLFIAQLNLKTAQNYLVSLKEAPARLEQVKAHLLQATTVLKAKEAVLTESQSKLAELKQVEAKAAHHYQTVLTAYQNHLEAQRQEGLAKQYESLVRAGKQPVPVVDGGGRVTGYVVDMPKEQPSPKAKLPKTGSVSSVLLPLLGYLGLAALVVNRRKENK